MEPYQWKNLFCRKQHDTKYKGLEQPRDCVCPVHLACTTTCAQKSRNLFKGNVREFVCV